VDDPGRAPRELRLGCDRAAPLQRRDALLRPSPDDLEETEAAEGRGTRRGELGGGAIGSLGLVAIAVGSVAIAYLKVRGLAS